MALAARCSLCGRWLHGGERTIVLPVRPSRRGGAGGRGALHAMLPLLLMLSLRLPPRQLPVQQVTAQGQWALQALLLILHLLLRRRPGLWHLCALHRCVRPCVVRGPCGVSCGLGPRCRWRAVVASSGMKGLARGRSNWQVLPRRRAAPGAASELSGLRPVALAPFGAGACRISPRP